MLPKATNESDSQGSTHSFGLHMNKTEWNSNGPFPLRCTLCQVSQQLISASFWFLTESQTAPIIQVLPHKHF